MAVRTHCRNGHELTSANTFIDAKGHRKCKTCKVIGQRRWEARHPGAMRGGPHIDAAPLLALIDKRIALFGHNDERPIPFDTTQIRRLRIKGTIDLYRADRFATALGMHPTEIWPDFDRIEDAA